MTQTVKYLKDYQKPNYLIPKVDLHFDVFDDHTLLTSHLHIQPQNPAETLCLNGSAELVSVRLNHETLANHAYSLENDVLTVFQPPKEAFILTIQTRLYPQNNTSLMGLYASGGNLYTQCEPEGFRKMTYHPDRPDVMSVYTTTICADKHTYPVLLSNGNCVEQGDLNQNRHWVKWHDPFAKPSYLFALVAGDLSCTRDVFTTQDGRDVTLAFYTRKQDANQVGFALESLKHAMRWDEQRFGLVYDLDIYMVVAVGDFNMGAMENKGLNIFNTKYVLANPATATDADFDGVESVIAHEYFHNWTGNRVTCRDWFQLSLKEGLTVFRDQAFSADRSGGGARRIEHVGLLRQHQFPEDAGPMAHPIRPASYVEMNNFYTMTVYEKGAEVVRMYHTLLGEEGFQKGMKLYFERHDGQAVTCDDFLAAMADANQRDLSQFALWYSQAGTPTLTVRSEWHNQSLTLHVEQSIPSTPDMAHKQAMMMPLKVALFDGETGEKRKFDYQGQRVDEAVLLVQDTQQRFVLNDVPEHVVPSLLRGFSAPVYLNYPYTNQQLSWLLSFDDDPFVCWEAAQILYRRAVKANEVALAQGLALPEHNELFDAVSDVLKADIDPMLQVALLRVPSEAELWVEHTQIDPVRVHQAREALLNALANRFQTEMMALAQEAKQHEENAKLPNPYAYEPQQAGWRALLNLCRAWLVRANDDYVAFIAQHYDEMAKNMTHEWGMLQAINHSHHVQRNHLLTQFAEKFQAHDLVMDKYFALIASSYRADTLSEIQKALNHPQFSWTNPNKVRALLGTFARQNVPHFHAADGSGYALLANAIRETDRINPQTAAALAKTFNLCAHLEPTRRTLVLQHLQDLAACSDLSPDTREIVEKILA